MRVILDASRGNTGNATKRGGNIPLPMASVSAGTEEYDGSRDSIAVIRAMYVNQDITSGVNVDWPTPVNIPYRLDLWCETQAQMWHFQDLIRNLFKLQTTYVDIDFTSPKWKMDEDDIPTKVKLLGHRQVALIFRDMTDASNLESGADRRSLRISIGCTLTAWMPRGYTEVPLVRSISVQILELENEVLLTTFALEP